LTTDDVKPGGSGRLLDLGFGAGGAVSSTIHLGVGSAAVCDLEAMVCDDYGGRDKVR
jgi:hypothetical protein